MNHTFLIKPPKKRRNPAENNITGETFGKIAVISRA
jgi:hypothetical protein